MKKNIIINYCKLLAIIIFMMANLMLAKSEQKTLKVASLSPNITEIIYQLKGDNFLVGRSSACNYPAQVQDLNIVGDFAGIFIEKLLKSNVKIVFSIPLPNLKHKEMLKKLNIELVELKFQSLDDYYRNVAIIGEKLNLQKNAQDEIERIKRLVDKQQKKIMSNKTKKKVLFIVWSKPLIVVGKGSFISEFITLSGGESLGNKLTNSYAKISKEWLIAQNPDLIIVSKHSEKMFKDLFSESDKKVLKAFQNDQVFALENEDQVLRFSPRVIDAINEISRLIDNKQKKIDEKSAIKK
ncbi:ABC transporter substrate-binding protein [Lentisphaerota bacterium WC36G]|nr:ABC transporter substrate-binding protein [Lentisphaerae bacterium WC36]